MIDIRPERPDHPADVDGVRAVNEAAFPTPAEADLVDALRADGAEAVSMVAVEDGEVIGHALFTPVQPERGPAGMAMAPMCVAPDRQNAGVGMQLVHACLDRLRADGCAWVVVLGHPRYYPRFGFLPASECVSFRPL